MSPATCDCGGTTRVLRMADKRRVVVMDDELNQITRWRACNTCDAYWPTVELRRSDLAELRRLAYLGHLASARASQPDPLGEALNSGNGSYRP